MASQFKKDEHYTYIENLQVGEFGEVLSNGIYKGMVVTRMFTGQFVAVYVPENDAGRKPFNVMWGGEGNTGCLKVRKLKKGEQVILSND